MKDMRLCAFCGNSASSDFSYCPHCGVPLKNLKTINPNTSVSNKNDDYSKRLDNLKTKLDEMETEINYFLSVKL